ncbi:hypothetical protein EHS13_05145 [Paenibacillus psychroresistens]|uniref:Sialate O-acetylesterase domain-containing protein n=1 Tax=Paenibacillus psychroresistens TaxID=1778678 RepID=A0A6B8RFI6_9BACL|nr:sialate O-acetylesterase [Paenibacillus psychroresistens]QGQ94335.1 hypothetical protein EHS13_05145 [Paenibacillus psychroresistens]
MVRAFHLVKPLPYQVVQRYGFQPYLANANHPGGPCLGFGIVRIEGKIGKDTKGKFEFRAQLINEAFRAADWHEMEVLREGDTFYGEAEVPAGGWYRLEVRLIDDESLLLSEASVEPFGIGEVFIIAGQSYAENANETAMAIEDSFGRISVYDPNLTMWRIANDPQPSIIIRPKKSEWHNGSIWPTAMNRLLPFIKVPIGLINVAAGGTASRQWVPGESLFTNLYNAGVWAGDFRYVFWQQGESDVYEDTDEEVYKRRIIAMKQELEQKWGFSRHWLLAKSTYHPSTYSKPKREALIRKAINDLWMLDGFLPGPDTDILGGDLYRAPANKGGHLAHSGQEAAGLLWFSAIWNQLNKLT